MTNSSRANILEVSKKVRVNSYYFKLLGLGMGFRLIHLPFFLSWRDLFSDKSRSMWRDLVGLGHY